MEYINVLEATMIADTIQNRMIGAPLKAGIKNLLTDCKLPIA